MNEPTIPTEDAGQLAAMAGSLSTTMTPAVHWVLCRAGFIADHKHDLNIRLTYIEQALADFVTMQPQICTPRAV